jgi:hypothetical protein
MREGDQKRHVGIRLVGGTAVMVSLIAVSPNWWNAATTHRAILSIRRPGGLSRAQARGGLDEAEKTAPSSVRRHVLPFDHLSRAAHLAQDQWLKGDASPKIATPRR